MSENLIVSVSPHVRAPMTTRKIMGIVLIALIPAFIASILFFGARAIAVVAVCVCAAVIAEFVFEKITKRGTTIGDLSAVVTGVLLAYNLPVSIPLWQAALGSAVAIVVVKQLFGGIGKNFANPAITARIIMLLAFPTTMTTWTAAKALIGGVDAVSSATPLALISANPEAMPSTLQLFIGQCGGSLGETSALALIIGFIILIAAGVITWHTPVVYVATVFVFTWILGENPVQHILSGGLMLGAIFMATDYSSTPSTNWGRVIFGFGAGILTTLIRIYANYPEGVSFSILLMNILTPHISNWTRSKPMGMIIEGKGDK